MNKPLIVITGPTASGKTTLALHVAQQYNGEIICADSRTIYKHLDIGTAKPSKEQQKLVRHHLIDVVEPNERFTVADFKALANKAIDSVTKRGKLPIIVGGTGLYVDAILFDYQFGPEADPKQRAELAQKTVEELQQICKKNNIELPENAMNKRYLIRAIETGGAQKGSRKLRPNTLVVAIATDKEDLKLRVTYRAEQMFYEGVLVEARYLGEKFGWESEAMKSIIYRILHRVITGEITEADALKLSIQSDMQLAKRQLTWLRRNPYIIWGTPDQLVVAIEHFVQQNKLSESIPESA